MKAECVTEKLESLISQAGRITGKNMTVPVLNYLYLEARDNTLTIKATNLDLGIELATQAKVEKDGVLAVPGDVLARFISSISDERSVTLEEQDGNLRVATAVTSTLIKAHPHEDFPNIPRIEGGASYTITARDFVVGLRSVHFSASTSSMKPELASVYVTHADGQLVFAATDSFRLAEKRIPAKKLDEFEEILIPSKNVAEIIRVLDSLDDSVTIEVGSNQISFSTKNVYLTSRTIDGTFPDYKQIIPEEFGTEVTLLKDDLQSALAIAHIFSDNLNQVYIKAHPSEKLFEIQTKNADVGENTNTLKATLEGDDIDITFNHRYIVDCFNSLATDSVALKFSGISKPMVIQPVSDASFFYLVMPMNR